MSWSTEPNYRIKDLLMKSPVIIYCNMISIAVYYVSLCLLLIMIEMRNKHTLAHYTTIPIQIVLLNLLYWWNQTETFALITVAK